MAAWTVAARRATNMVQLSSQTTSSLLHRRGLAGAAGNFPALLPSCMPALFYVPCRKRAFRIDSSLLKNLPLLNRFPRKTFESVIETILPVQVYVDIEIQGNLPQ
ncbi:hypothetical protein JHK82_034648 [Glycine max]|nr:hypothetical protein JHK85_035366 [Glycine max]KAG4987030.1 hypothetical protein JHK86_034721 [Glycine max]KAG5120228.1 hypothetical protein JHK82_034648 [Glycine max]KAG5141215.1 hypothetical protein JHK84_034983 [Glycine max]